MRFEDLRPHQQKAVQMLRGGWKQYDTHLINAACGFGKTALGSYLCRSFADRGKKVVFAAPYVTLVNQTFEKFEEYGHSDLSVIWRRDARYRKNCRIQIASADTLIRREFPEDAEVLIVDEAHLKRKALLEVMKKPGLKTIGLTATPYPKWMGSVYQNFIKPCTTRELIEAELLTPFDIYSPQPPEIEKGLKLKKNEFGELDIPDDYAAKVMGDAKIVGDVLDNWIKNGDNLPTIAFAPNVSTANAYCLAFQKAGITSEVITADTDPLKERGPMFYRFKTGRTKVLWNVGVLGAGFDADVRCIIWAKMTKSEIVWVQGTMRGSRPAPGKKDCIARGSKILTNFGLVNIEDITIDHKVWDGVNFVEHSGAVCKGFQDVIFYDGLWATPDHEVMTEYGWEAFEEVARRSGKIIDSGRGWEAIRVSEDNFKENSGGVIQPDGACPVHGLRRGANGEIPQHEEEAGQKGMRNMPQENPGGCSWLALHALQRAAAKMSKSVSSIIRKVWRERNSVQIQKCKPSIKVDSAESWYSRRQGQLGVGPHKQRWSLRAWEFAMGKAIPEREKHQADEIQSRAVYGVPDDVSRDKVRGYYPGRLHQERDDRRGDFSEMESPLIKAKREVWDIHNCGPLQRFTANNKLVHNCKLFDHAGTFWSLGDPCDIEYYELHDGTAEEDRKRQQKKEKTEKEAKQKICKACGHVKAPGEFICSRCGYKPLIGEITVEVDESRGLESVDGKAKKEKQLTTEQKRQLYSELRYYALEHGKKDGWVAHKFRNKTGVWPNHYKDAIPVPPSPETLNYIKHEQIKFAKSRARA